MAKKVIKAMSSDDFIEEKGTLKTQIKRGVTIKDKSQNLTVDMSMNHKKGTFDISFKWNMDAITNDNVVDSATLDSAASIMMAARDKCLKWRDEWKNDNPSDPDQMELGIKD